MSIVSMWFQTNHDAKLEEKGLLLLAPLSVSEADFKDFV